MADAKRRLAAILAADVAGYSRLMADDERATMDTLNAYRDVFRTQVAAHDGRVVDTAGDSVLAVFDSVVEAVQCAADVQADLETRNAELDEDRRMRFRIGVNLGDVFEQTDGTLYGDGVNVAARVEGLAAPGGICVSEPVHFQVKTKLDFPFDDLGEHSVKNIAEPVRVYRLGDGVAPAVVESPDQQLPDKPSIAVLPFDNLSRDPDQDYFADGISEDLITELSRLRWLQVSSRNSTFTYKGQATDAKRVGADLAVRFVVEGSVRRSADRVRITAQLIDAGTGNHIWAERYDRDLTDIFALQDEITETLVAALQAEVGEFERARARRKPPESLDAWEFYQRGLWHLWRYNTEDFAEARALFERAVDRDPGFAQALAAWSYVLFCELANGLTDSPIDHLNQAKHLADRAVAADDKDAMAHCTLGRVHILDGEIESAIAEFRTAIDLNPSLTLAHTGLAIALTFDGQLAAAIEVSDTAIRLSPREPFAWGFYSSRAIAHLLAGNFAVAADDAGRASRHPTASFWAQAHLVSALALHGRQAEAEAALDKLMKTRPDFDPDEFLAAFAPRDPESLRPILQPWFDGFRKAGLNNP